MTIENWLMIALIITTLIAPVLQGLVQSRLNQPRPAPDPTHPNTLIHKIGGWLLHVSNSPWYLPPLLIVLNTVWLIVDLHRTTPITRRVIYQIASEASGIWYGLVLFLLNTAWQAIRNQWDINRDQSQTNKMQSEIDHSIIDLIKCLANDLHTTAENITLIQRSQQLQAELTEIKKPTPGRLSKLLRGLLGR